MRNTPNISRVIRYAQENITPPCKECAERKVGCHGECEKYDDYTKHLKTEKEKIINAYNTEKLLEDSEIKGRIRTLKRRNHKYKVGVNCGGYTNIYKH